MQNGNSGGSDGGNDNISASDDEPVEMVYVPSQNGTGRITKLHTDPSCPYLDQSKTVMERPRSIFPDDRPKCKWCEGTARTDKNGEGSMDLVNKLSDPDFGPTDAGLSPRLDSEGAED